MYLNLGQFKKKNGVFILTKTENEPVHLSILLLGGRLNLKVSLNYFCFYSFMRGFSRASSS